MMITEREYNQIQRVARSLLGLAFELGTTEPIGQEAFRSATRLIELRRQAAIEGTAEASEELLRELEAVG